MCNVLNYKGLTKSSSRIITWTPITPRRPASLIGKFAQRGFWKRRIIYNRIRSTLMENQNLPNFLYDRIPKIQAMSMLVDCPNCRTTLNLPEGARSIRCSVCQTVTKIADTVVPSLRPSPFADVTGYAPSPSPYTNAPPYPYGVSPFPGLAAHVPSPYNNAPSSPSAVTAYPGLVPHMPSPSHLSYSPPSVYGRKKAVIVGVSYKNTSHELKGCLNDAKYMKYLLIKTFQFPESSIRMLTGMNPNLCLGWQ